MAIKFGRPIESRTRFTPIETRPAAQDEQLDLCRAHAPQPAQRMGAPHGARTRSHAPTI